jgi:hypothetical protein
MKVGFSLKSPEVPRRREHDAAFARVTVFCYSLALGACESGGEHAALQTLSREPRFLLTNLGPRVLEQHNGGRICLRYTFFTNL